MDRQALIAAMQRTAERKVTAVAVPEWGTMYIRLLTVAEVDEQTADTRAAQKVDEEGNIIKYDRTRFARAAARAMCDEKGDPIFDPHNAADVELLASQPWKLLRQVLDASDKLEEEKEVKEKGEGKG